MKSAHASFLAFFLHFFAPSSAWAGPHDFYECTDINGVVSYSVERCANGSRQRRVADETVPKTIDLGKAANAQPVSLMADSRGQFFTDGTINGVGMRFVVDTGATFVSLGASDASRAGIDFRKGRPAISTTANGQMRSWIVTLDSVSIGGVTMRKVSAAVSENSHPVLLGMSFLQRMTVVVDGPVMTLTAR